MRTVEPKLTSEQLVEKYAAFFVEPDLGFDQPLPHSIVPDNPDAPADAGKPLPLIRFDNAAVDLTSNYLVENLLDDGAASMMYGDSNTGKTFVALDLAAHIAAGLPWFGRRVRQGAVIYVATEAGRSAERRVAAWRKHHSIARAPLWLVPYPTDLLGNADTERLIETIKQVKAEARAEGWVVKLIVIDTLSRALAGGNENDSKDMGTFVRHIDRLRIVSGSHLLIVHHTGKDAARGARGHSLVRAAVDTELEVSDHTLTVTKQRDQEFGAPVKFGLRVVELGDDDDGRRITSCVVGPPELFEIPRQDMDDKERIAHELLREIVADKRAQPGAKEDTGARRSEWLVAYARHEGVAFADPAELRKSDIEKTWERLARSLREKRWVAKNGRDQYAPVEIG